MWGFFDIDAELLDIDVGLFLHIDVGLLGYGCEAFWILMWGILDMDVGLCGY